MNNPLSFITRPRYDPQTIRFLWWRALIIAVTLLSSFVLAYTGGVSQLSLLLFLFFAVVGVLALVRWPLLGFIIITIGGMLLPVVGPAGLNVSVGVVGLMLGIWLADMVVVKREIKVSSSRTVWPLLGLVVVALLSFIAGQFPWFTFANNAPLDAQAGGFAIFILSAGTFLLMAHLVKDIRWLEIMVWLFLAVGTLFLAGRASALVRPLTTAIIQPQAIGGVFYAWFPALTLGQAFFNRNLHPFIRAALIGATALALYVGLFIFFNWKSGWLPPVAAVLVITFFRARRLTIIAALLAIVPVMLFIPDFLASDSYSVSTRLDAWIIMGEIVKVNPILGLGFANYYWYTPLFRIRGWTVTFNSHNNYVDIVAQTGISGLLFFLWFFVEIGRLAWRLKDNVPEGFAQAYVYSCLGGIVSTLVAAMLGDWVLPFVYNIGLSGFRTGVLAWLFLGGLVAIENIYVNGKRSEPDALLPSPKSIG